MNSIFFWADPERGISEIYRVLRQGGKLALTFTLPEDLAHLGFYRHGFRTYPPERIRTLLSNAGFVVSHETRGSDRQRRFACIEAFK